MYINRKKKSARFHFSYNRLCCRTFKFWKFWDLEYYSNGDYMYVLDLYQRRFLKFQGCDMYVNLQLHANVYRYSFIIFSQKVSYMYMYIICTFEHDDDSQPKNETRSHVATSSQDALNLWNCGKYARISSLALSSKLSSVVSLYQTVPPLVVSTSAQNGTIILALFAIGKGVGVYVDTLCKNEITPFVLTWKGKINVSDSDLTILDCWT
jgi:hypothetical protein